MVKILSAFITYKKTRKKPFMTFFISGMIINTTISTTEVVNLSYQYQ